MSNLKGFHNPLENNPLFNPAQEQEAEREKKKFGRPRKEGVQRDGAGAGLQEGTTRYTVIFHNSTMKFLRDYAFTKRITIKEAMRIMIEKFEADYYADPNNEKLISRDGDDE